MMEMTLSVAVSACLFLFLVVFYEKENVFILMCRLPFLF